MGEDGVVARLCNVKALLGILAGAGASYGIYKLVSRVRSDCGRGGRTSSTREEGSRAERRPALQPGTLLAKVSGIPLLRGSDRRAAALRSSGAMEPHHVEKLLALLQSGAAEKVHVLVTLGNCAAFSHNQDLIRELGGLPVIAGLLSDPLPEVRAQALNALNNLSMNVRNQEQLKVYVPQVLELIEMSPVNSDLQLASLRLLTNMSVTNNHQHLLRNSITLFLSLLVVSNETLQIQVLKVLVNLSANPEMMEDIVQAQAPASLVLLFDGRTHLEVLLRLLTFVGNLKTWQDSFLTAAPIGGPSCHGRDSVYRVLLAENSELRHRLPALLSHPDVEVKAQVARLLT
ncbi:armadillo repeat-containing protein 10 isoform X2 [Scleropages formosus]|uniref:Armadillo repeat containing 10 n=2 Tax=Scleropages formosus TaxID=113540 RepID=A0A8C9R487_SCLFO|nr:armadillo repeat-containing protein 10 isoform X2 [Scleropages formosus]XP_029105576.1 armadillo repeat-containing protein 10 isoform X2 [Scleropages formosus]XP_029105578.1 armadillo repeat-containing protein 10 isoform X2 [Scleropages formosus]XP_029105579.1 armadillo repeat-containing protein 10 isoform X2 [Scleropages formosus]